MSMKRTAGRAGSYLVGFCTLSGVLLCVACGDDVTSGGGGGSSAAGTSSGGKSSSGSAAGSSAGTPATGGDGEPVVGGAGGAGEVVPGAAHDIVVYGCTSAGVIAAVQAKRMQKSVILVCPDEHLGGLSSQGLGWTDTGDNSVIGGLSRNFYARIKTIYDDDARWKQQTKASYSHYDANADSMWVFEPHVAEEIFEDLVTEYQLPIVRNEWLNRETGVALDG